MIMAETSPSEPIQVKPANTRKIGLPGILLRLFLAGLTGAILGAVIYYTAIGWIPYLDQRIFEPINKNQGAVLDLQSTQEYLDSQIQDLEDNLANYQARLDSFDMEMLQLSEDDLSLLATVDNNTLFMLQHTQSLATLDAKQVSTDRNLSALATAQMSYAGSQLKFDLLLIIDRFSRANQHILHTNYGLAKSELLSAQADLEAMLLEAYGYQQAVLNELLELVGQIIADLPNNPLLAENKLELAWQLAIQGFPEISSGGTFTPTPFQTPSITNTPTPGSD
jgi:hypothetical protein